MSPITCFGLSALLTCPPLLKTAVISAIFLLFSLLLYSYSSFVGSTCFPSAESTASAASADQPPGSSSPVHTGSWLLPYALVCCSPFVFLTIFFSFPCTAMPLCSAAFFFVCWLKPKHSPFFSLSFLVGAGSCRDSSLSPAFPCMTSLPVQLMAPLAAFGLP